METIAHIILGGGIFLAIIVVVVLVLAMAKKARQSSGQTPNQQPQGPAAQGQAPAAATPPATPQQITPLWAIVLIAIAVVIGWVLVSQPEKPAWVEERMVEKTEVIGTDWKRLDPPRASFRWEVFKKNSEDRVWVTSTGWTEPYEVKNSPNSTIPHVKFDNLRLKADKENVEVEIYYFCR